MMPMMSHTRWPVMKLPGSTPEPCKTQTPPAKMAIRPRIKLPIRIQLHYAPAVRSSLAKLKFARARSASSPGEARLGFCGDRLWRHRQILAGAAARFDLGQRQLPDVEPLDGGQPAERPQEVLPAAPLHDAAQLVLQPLDAFHEGDAEGVCDPRALRTELFLDELLRVAGETLVADDYALGSLDAGDLRVEGIGVRQVELAILEHYEDEVTAQIEHDVGPRWAGVDDHLLAADAELGEDGGRQGRHPAALVVEGGGAVGRHDDLVDPLLVQRTPAGAFHPVGRHLLQLVGIVGAQHGIARPGAHDHILGLDQAKAAELAQAAGDGGPLRFAQDLGQVRHRERANALEIPNQGANLRRREGAHRLVFFGTHLVDRLSGFADRVEIVAADRSEHGPRRRRAYFLAEGLLGLGPDALEEVGTDLSGLGAIRP